MQKYFGPFLHSYGLTENSSKKIEERLTKRRSLGEKTRRGDKLFQQHLHSGTLTAPFVAQTGLNKETD